MPKSLIIAAAAFLAAAPAAAQPADEMVRGIAALARDNLARARLPDGSQVPPESAAERARPIVPAALEIDTVRRAALTAQLQACGGDWERVSFLPYMAQLRASRRFTGRQLAYVALLHGIAQEIVLGSLTDRPDPCPTRTRAALAGALAGPSGKR